MSNKEEEIIIYDNGGTLKRGLRVFKGVVKKQKYIMVKNNSLIIWNGKKMYGFIRVLDFPIESGKYEIVQSSINRTTIKKIENLTARGIKQADFILQSVLNDKYHNFFGRNLSGAIRKLNRVENMDIPISLVCDICNDAIREGNISSGRLVLIYPSGNDYFFCKMIDYKTDRV